ncbi:MAG: amidohydrolase family protein [Pseudomonadota bacterium]
MTSHTRTLLVTNGRIYRHGGDPDLPPVRDMLVKGDRIVAIEADLAAQLRTAEGRARHGVERLDTVLDARDRLVLPGFVNGHYHSHDVLLKGCFETIPLETWLLQALPPNYGRRSKAELRARTLLGAAECLRGGITTVQDMLTLVPIDEDDMRVVMDAYEEIGIRCVFSLQVADVGGAKGMAHWDECVPDDKKHLLSGSVNPEPRDLIEVLDDIVTRWQGHHPRIGWALAPTSPERCTRTMLERLAELSGKHRLPVFTHIYESRAMTLVARHEHAAYDGSLVRYLDACGLLNERMGLAHSVWMREDEIDLIGEKGAHVVLNPVGNLKTKSGVAPIRSYVDKKVNISIGCDNCSCSDVQNMFQAMKLFADLAAICDPEPGRPFAVDALRCATLGGAKALQREGELGDLEPGMLADFSLIDLTDFSYVPLNSCARQTVFTESGRGVTTVVVGGEVVMQDRKVTTIDEAALREEVSALMPSLQAEIQAVVARIAELEPYLAEANRRTWRDDVGLHRYVGYPPA